ncbi:unnamed protein product, partial [Nesidiocoris tenuis]
VNDGHQHQGEKASGRSREHLTAHEHVKFWLRWAAAGLCFLTEGNPICLQRPPSRAATGVQPKKKVAPGSCPMRGRFGQFGSQSLFAAAGQILSAGLLNVRKKKRTPTALCNEKTDSLCLAIVLDSGACESPFSATATQLFKFSKLQHLNKRRITKVTLVDLNVEILVDIGSGRTCIQLGIGSNSHTARSFLSGIVVPFDGFPYLDKVPMMKSFQSRIFDKTYGHVFGSFSSPCSLIRNSVDKRPSVNLKGRESGTETRSGTFNSKQPNSPFPSISPRV